MDKKKIDSVKKQQIKTPCCAVLGHVDVGKTKLLDYLRHTETEEAQGISQQIGTTLYSRQRLEKLIGNLKDNIGLDALLMIDTPGHECFDLIRYVALKVSDIVILIIDMIKGIEKQTINIISLLQKHNVFFIICVNKMDRIYGWQKNTLDSNNNNLANVLHRMSPPVREKYDHYINQIKLKLYEYDVISELYYLNKSPNIIINIVPISAGTGEGIPDLLMLIGGLCLRKYLSDPLIDTKITHGYILDSHYDKHYGHYYQIIHRFGKLSKDDHVIIKNIKYRIRQILVNSDNEEIKDEHRFTRVNMIDRSCGAGLLLDVPSLSFLDHGAIEPGSLYVLETDAERVMNQNQAIDPSGQQIEDPGYEKIWQTKYLCKKGDPGIQVIAPSHIMMDGLLHIIKAQSKSDPESLNIGVKSEPIAIERCKVGKIDKKDIWIGAKWLKREIDCPENKMNMEKYAIILSYDPSADIDKSLLEIADQHKVKIIHSNVVYKLLEEYEHYIASIDKRLAVLKNEPSVIIQIIPKYIFRTTGPMVFGVKILSGVLNTNCTIYAATGLLAPGTPVTGPEAPGTPVTGPEAPGTPVTRQSVLIGQVSSIQKNNANIPSIGVDQEACIKIMTKKVIGSDVTKDAILYGFQIN
jgi:translation initiation factor 5B